MSYTCRNRIAAFLPLCLILTACGGGSDNAPPAPPDTSIATESVPSDTIANATVITGTDANGVQIQVVVETDLASNVSITQGVDIGLSTDYRTITNGFIEIYVGSSATGKQRITVDSPSPFEVILAVDFNDSIIAYTPFYTTESGAVEFFLQPQTGRITFALMDVPEL